LNTSATSLLDCAAAAAGAQQYPAATLYVVATPIGNLADLSLRAIHVLTLVDAVACEDTRVTRSLLRHLGVDKPLLAVHAHNERQVCAAVVERLARGERVAYASDAGTPAVSDPGAALVAAVQHGGYRCVPIPGASAAMAALCVAGDVAYGPVHFLGFPPPKGAARAAALADLARNRAAAVVYEAPHRIAALLGALAEACPDRRLTVARELTKQFEEVATLAARHAPPWLAASASRGRGEFVVVLHATPQAAPADGDPSGDVLQALLAELPLSQAVALAARITGNPRNELYARALAIQAASTD
jgi:16S rRNA (cytidine1402-2'-O)-methyltransferase